MHLHIKPRCSGKTDWAIHEAARLEAELKANGGNGCFYILCATKEDASRISTRTRELAVNGRFPITVGEALSGGCTGRYVVGLVIDDLDRVLPLLLGRPVLAATMTEGE